MTDRLLNLVRLEVERVLRQLVAAPRQAIVDTYDPVRNAAKVLLLPEEKPTGWLPLKTEWMGNGWGEVSPVNPGDQVMVLFQEHDKDSGVILGRIYDSRNAPPQGAGATEKWFVHKTGSVIKLLDSGDVQLVSSRDLNATVGRDLTATVGRNATLTVTGTAAIYAAAIKLGKQAADALQGLMMAAAWTWLKGHTHSGVTTGSGTSGGPNSVPADSAALTSIVTGE